MAVINLNRDVRPSRIRHVGQTYGLASEHAPKAGQKPDIPLILPDGIDNFPQEKNHAAFPFADGDHERPIDEHHVRPD
jgi:hypothetical protein